MLGPTLPTPSKSRHICFAVSQSCAAQASRKRVTGDGPIQTLNDQQLEAPSMT